MESENEDEIAQSVYYKELHEESKRQNENLHKRSTTVNNKYGNLLVQFNDLTEEHKMMKDQYESSWEENDATIQTL